MKTNLSTYLLCTILAIYSQSVFASDTDPVKCWNSAAILVEAENLEETAEHFSELLLTVPNYAHLSVDAEALAEEASHFQDAVRSGEDCHHLRVDFRQVYEAAYRTYRRVLRAHKKYHNPHIVEDWNDMVNAYHLTLREVRKTRAQQARFNESLANRSGNNFQIPLLRS